MYAIITENDESKWNDQTGIAYHFPKRALPLIPPETKVIYYKGKLRSRQYLGSRLSIKPHYFGTAVVGKVYLDRQSEKGDYFALLRDFKPFAEAVLSKTGDGYLEQIPKNRETNYWRDGTRSISKEIFLRILNAASPIEEPFLAQAKQSKYNDLSQKYESFEEGNKSLRYTTVYERNVRLRQQAILIHGASCVICGFNYEKVYGEYAAGYIHIHHTKPLATLEKSTTIDPEKDLIPLCANCHSIVHRKKDSTLKIEQLRQMILNNQHE